MTVKEDAVRLESLLPAAMGIFRITEDPAAELTTTQIRLVRHLFDGECPAGELAERLKVSPSSLSQLVERLVQRGWIERKASLEDRRIKTLALTVKGRALIRTRRKLRAEAAIRALGKLDIDRRRELISILEELTRLSAVAAVSDPSIEP